MTKLSIEMQAAIERSELLPLATASEISIPNVVPIKFVWVEKDDEIWLVDNYMNKTLDNIKENPIAALYVYSREPELCFQVKGNIEIQTAGREYERMREKVLSDRPDLPAKSLIIMHITDVFQCLPGADAGQRIDL